MRSFWSAQFYMFNTHVDYSHICFFPNVVIRWIYCMQQSFLVIRRSKRAVQMPLESWKPYPLWKWSIHHSIINQSAEIGGLMQRNKRTKLMQALLGESQGPQPRTSTRWTALTYYATHSFQSSKWASFIDWCTVGFGFPTGDSLLGFVFRLKRPCHPEIQLVLSTSCI